MTAFIKSLAKAIVSTVEEVLDRTSLTATAFDTAAYDGQLLFVLVAGDETASATGPTLDVKLTHCDTAGGTYEDVPDGAFDQVTGAAVDTLNVDRNALKRWVKVDATFDEASGGPASFPVGVFCAAFKKYE